MLLLLSLLFDFKAANFEETDLQIGTHVTQFLASLCLHKL